MAVALKDRPVLTFQAAARRDDGAAGTRGSGAVTDAFKPDQVPGASRPLGAAVATAPGGGRSTPADASQAVHGGVDSSLGGIY